MIGNDIIFLLACVVFVLLAAGCTLLALVCYHTL
jgi:hypothetical protein